MAEQPKRPGTLDHGPPRPRTSLVGRSDHAATVVAALADSRIVTLTGPGGVGKTRLALAVADLARDLARDGSWWVELADLTSSDLVAETVARGVRARSTRDRSPVEAAAHRIGTSMAVLVLDNCEHVGAACANVVDAILDACPELRVLATSREPLGVVGETVWPVPPLSLPAPDEPAALESICESAAVRLFEQRTRAVVPEFRLSESNAEVVARLCRRLDGLPLPIELAAARMRVLSVTQIVAGLDDVFRLLVGGARTGPVRHQTLRATLDWSHDLLTEPERVVFRRLSIFPGAFDLSAAEHVASAGGIVDQPDVLDLLTRLVDRSLIVVRRAQGSVRYRLLATVRDYARGLLQAAGERVIGGRAHLQHYCEVAERAEPLLTGPNQVATLDQLEEEGNNLRVALAFARDEGDTETGTRLAAALWRLCCLRGHYREGRLWLDWAASADPDGRPALRAKALRGGGSLAFLQCDYPAAVRRLEASLQLYRDLDDRMGVASVLQVLGTVAREQGRYARAEALHGESLELFTSAGDRLGVAQARGYLGFLAWLQRQWTTAVDHCELALTEFRSLGDAEGIAWSLISLGTVAQYQGDYARARALLDEVHELAMTIKFPEGIAWSLHERGVLALRLGERNAEELLLASLDRHRRLGDRWRTSSVLVDLAAARLGWGAAGSAAALLGAAARIREEIGTEIAPCERADHEGVQHGARNKLGADEFETAWARGRESPVDELLAGAPGERTEAIRQSVIPEQQRGPDEAAVETASPPPVTTVAAAEPLRIRMLGASTVHRGDRLLSPADWGYGKPRELLFLLAGAGGGTKQQIGAALWPDLAGNQLRNAFHTALRDMRRALGDAGWVVFAEGRYVLDGSRDLRSDLRAFESSLGAARSAKPGGAALPHLQRAIAAYGGEFLPDVQDVEWVETRRAELGRRYRSALSAAGRLLVAAGRYAEAAEIYRVAVREDPFEETAHRQLMACLMRVGESARAVQVYQQLCDRLRDELGIAPAAETTALYRQLTPAR